MATKCFEKNDLNFEISSVAMLCTFFMQYYKDTFISYLCMEANFCFSRVKSKRADRRWKSCCHHQVQKVFDFKKLPVSRRLLRTPVVARELNDWTKCHAKLQKTRSTKRHRLRYVSLYRRDLRHRWMKSWRKFYNLLFIYFYLKLHFRKFVVAPLFWLKILRHASCSFSKSMNTPVAVVEITFQHESES